MIENGNIIAERDDDNSSDFVPSVKAKHRPPNTLTGAPQERPKKKNFCGGNRKCVESLSGKNEDKEEEEEEEEEEEKEKEEEEVVLNFCNTSRKRNVVEGEKKLPNREGHGINLRYGNGNRVKFQKKNVTNTFALPDEIPKEKEAEFVRANHDFYVVLTPGLELSEKLITFCCGCGGKIK